MKIFWQILIIGGVLVLIVLIISLREARVDGVVPNTVASPQQTPVVSEPVTPGLSPKVLTLPTVTPRPPGAPLPEVNPRRLGTPQPTSTPSTR